MATFIPIAIAAIGAGAATYGAVQQNKQVRQAKRSAAEGAAVQSKQLEEQAGLERIKRLREMASIQGRIKVNAAGAGLANTGTFEQLQDQAASDARQNLDILQQNLANQKARVSSGLLADLSSLSMQKRTVALDAFQGGLGGASTGLSIYGGGKDAGLWGRTADQPTT